MKSEAELVPRLKAGEEAAWRHFMDEQGKLIFLVGKRLGLPQDDREEVFQNTCLSVLRFVDALRDPGKLSSWVYSIAYRHSLDILRRRRTHSGRMDATDILNRLHDDSPGALEVLEDLDHAEELLEALEDLPPRCRKILKAMYLDPDQPSYEEIGKREGIPVGSIGPTRARCLQKLRRLLFKVSYGPSHKSI